MIPTVSDAEERRAAAGMQFYLAPHGGDYNLGVPEGSCRGVRCIG